jgi:hypothetical protein
MTAARILGAMFLIAATLPARAADIPAKYRGEWCDHGSGSYFVPYDRSRCRRHGDGYLRITATGTEYDRNAEDITHCRVIKVQTPPDGIGPDHIITFTCGGRTLTSQFYATYEHMRRIIRLYIEPLDSDQKDSP